ncbi:MAG: leucine-rich repeat domain-containing protein, partial [Clostridia bacterium]|nr:leucine-rich repeat domain-containing protein [Clostridia bacterium]
CGDNLTWSYNTSTATLTISGTGAMTDYFYSNIGNYTYVTTAPWKEYYNTMKTVVIGNGVTTIGKEAFYGCTGLTSITIPDSVTTIGRYALEGCTGLTSVTIPDSVTTIGDCAFYGCTGLTSITIPDSVTTIGGSAFYNTAWFNNQPDGMVYIGKVAYKYKGTCPSTVILRNDTVGIAEDAFAWCEGLTSITIPDSVTTIGEYAFEDCTGLTSITIGTGVTSIGWGAFYKCTGLTSITIPNSVTTIGEYAFYDCTGLKSITIGTGVTSIGGYTFEGCTGLTSITIPDSFTTIGDATFYRCTGLKSITIPDSVTSIGEDAFSGCTGLTSITIPDSVTSIGSWAFEYCTGLKSITIPDSVTTIGYGAFSYCAGLTSVTIPTSISYISTDVFIGCRAIADVYYTGAEKWSNTSIYIGNEDLLFANIHFATTYCSVNGHDFSKTTVYGSTVCSNCGILEQGCENLKIGTQTHKNGNTRLILKLSDSAEEIASYPYISFVVTIDGVKTEIFVDSVYDSFYNNGKLVTAEDLNCTYVAVLDIGNISDAQSVTVQGYYTNENYIVYHCSGTRTVK